jgi:hypothetical protein
LLWELGGSLLILLAFPRLYDSTSWRYVLDYTPDLGLFALVVAGVWMLTGVTRIVKMHRPARERIPSRVISRRRTEGVAR